MRRPTSDANIQSRKIVETSENDQGQLKDWVLASKRFSAREKAAYNVHSVDAFREYWQDANSAKEDFDQSHEKGCGLWAKRYQSSTALIKPFFDDFSPLVRIVKDLGAPYGGVALATMTLLFAVSAKSASFGPFILYYEQVAVNKNEMEESLALTISSIRDRLPGLRLYQRIYDDDLELDRALQKEIIYAYRGFMDFCTIATRYYKRGGPRRRLIDSPSPLSPANGVITNTRPRRTLAESIDPCQHIFRQGERSKSAHSANTTSWRGIVEQECG